MSHPLDGGERSVRSPRPIPLLLLLLVLLSTVVPAAAQTNLSGDYEADLTFDDITPPCINPNYEDPLSDWPMTVLMRGTSNVDITLHDLPSAGEDLVFNASLNENLDVYAELEGRDITGQFAVTGTGVSFDGNVLWLNECPTDPNDPSQRAPVAQRFSVHANRVSGGGETQTSPSPSTTDDLVAVGLAEAAFEQECPSEGQDSDHCADALNYADDWKLAMAGDIGALNLDPSSDASAELARLRVIMQYAAALGGLRFGGPTALLPLFPVIHGLLPVFGHLFVQGVSEAATGRIDELRNTVGRAERLLALALSAAETRRGTVG
ncbi:MAG: hypothetical protein ACRDH9_13005 [Actinomycetota bacterium]